LNEGKGVGGEPLNHGGPSKRNAPDPVSFALAAANVEPARPLDEPARIAIRGYFDPQTID
jgi:hypothetical protein